MGDNKDIKDLKRSMNTTMEHISSLEILPTLKLGESASTPRFASSRPNDLLKRISQTFPIPLMQKLNHNPLLLDRKKKLEKESRQIAARDFHQDPRWRHIESSIQNQR